MNIQFQMVLYGFVSLLSGFLFMLASGSFEVALSVFFVFLGCIFFDLNRQIHIEELRDTIRLQMVIIKKQKDKVKNE